MYLIASMSYSFTRECSPILYEHETGEIAGKQPMQLWRQWRYGTISGTMPLSKYGWHSADSHTKFLRSSG